MSDTRLRDLERKWRETSDEGDLERYIRELVRAGVIPAGTQGTNIPYSELSSGEKTYVRILAEYAPTIAGFGEPLQSEFYLRLLAMSTAQRTIDPNPEIPQDRLNAIIAETYAGWLISDVIEFRAQASDDDLREFVRDADECYLRPRVENSHLTEQQRANTYCIAANITRQIIGTDACEKDQRIQLFFPLLALSNPDFPNIQLESELTHALPRPQKTYQMPEWLKVNI